MSSDYRQTESDAYEPTMHKHKCAQKVVAVVRVLCYYLYTDQALCHTILPLTVIGVLNIG